jgi:hypothetical protein
MHRLLECPGFVKMSEGIPNPDSEFAAEGTLLHDIASEILTERGDKRFNALTAEQREVVTAYVEFVREEQGAMQWDSKTKMLVEQRFSMPDLHKEFYGTADCVLVNDSELKVIDLKCGAGISVEADYDGEPNPQLVFYLLGVLVSLGVKITRSNVYWPKGWTPKKFEIIIVQPRAGGVKRRTVYAPDLFKYIKLFHNAALLADTPDAPVKAGKHCKFCLATARCPELKKMAVEKAQNEFGEFHEVSDMSDTELADALSTANLMEMWIKGVREAAFKRLKSGSKVPGYKIVDSLGIRRWRDAAAAQDFILDIADAADDVVEVFDRKLKSPTQMEKTLKAGGWSKQQIQIVMDQFVTRNVSQTLTHEGDERPDARSGAEFDFD